jgi:hypothetical protein
VRLFGLGLGGLVWVWVLAFELLLKANARLIRGGRGMFRLEEQLSSHGTAPKSLAAYPHRARVCVQPLARRFDIPPDIPANTTADAHARADIRHHSFHRHERCGAYRTSKVENLGAACPPIKSIAIQPPNLDTTWSGMIQLRVVLPYYPSLPRILGKVKKKTHGFKDLARCRGNSFGLNGAVGDGSE